MKLIRWGAAGAERPGLVDRAGVARDLSGHVTDITPEILSDAVEEMVRWVSPVMLMRRTVTRDTDLANRGFQREMVNRPIPETLRDDLKTALPTAFGGSAYDTQFQPDEREGIRNASTEIARLNNLPADTASHVAAKIILDPADDEKDAAYKATPMKNFAGGASGTFVRLTPQKLSPNLPEIVMPASHYMNLIATRVLTSGCSATQTSPMPPRPSGAVIRNPFTTSSITMATVTCRRERTSCFVACATAAGSPGLLAIAHASVGGRAALARRR